MEMDTAIEDEDCAGEETAPEEVTAHPDASPGNGGTDGADGIETQDRFTTGQTSNSAVNEHNECVLLSTYHNPF